MKFQAIPFLLALSIAMAGCAARNVAIEIPENYKGWVIVRYSAQDCSQAEDGGWFQSVVKIQLNGEGCSSRWQGAGNLTGVMFYYVDSSGRRKRRLKDSGWGGGGEIWGRTGDPEKKEYHVYVGPESSFRHSPFPARP